MQTVQENRDFENLLLSYSELCNAVALALTKDLYAARHLAEVTMLHAWADRDSLDLSTGLKTVLLSKMRATFLKKYQQQVLAESSTDFTSLTKRLEHVLS